MSYNVLCVASHPDDETLGCGGTLAKHAAAGDRVSVLVMADGETSRPGGQPKVRQEQCRQALRILGVSDVWFCEYPDQRMDTVPLLEIARHIEHTVGERAIGTVYTHWHGDLNQDHRCVAEATAIACRPGSGVRRLLMFEVPSSTERGGGFAPNWFEEIDIEKKLGAFSCYTTEVRAFPHPRSLEAIAALAKWRGATAGMAAAEAFVLSRYVS